VNHAIPFIVANNPCGSFSINVPTLIIAARPITKPAQPNQRLKTPVLKIIIAAPIIAIPP